MEKEIEKKKYSFNLKVELVEEIDRMASILGIDRNAYVSAILTLNVLSLEKKNLDDVYSKKIKKGV